MSGFIKKSSKKSMDQVSISGKLAVFHSAAAIHNAVSVYVCIHGLEVMGISTDLFNLLDIQLHDDPVRFITMWNMVLQSIYFTLALLTDLTGLNSSLASVHNLLKYIKDFAFASWLFPVGTFVCSIFWMAYWMSDALIVTDQRMQVFLLSAYHSSHSAPAVFAIFELWLVPHAYPNRRTGLLALSSCLIPYILYFSLETFMVSSSFLTGKWPYPFLNDLTLQQLMMLPGTLLGLAFLHYIAGEALNTLLWGENP